MKKIILIIILILAGVLFYFSYVKEKTQVFDEVEVIEVTDSDEQIVKKPTVEYDNIKRSFNTSSAEEFKCKDDNGICAIDLAVRCTINPNLSFCDKSKLPRFIFMNEEALGRPSKIDFTVVKTHPIDMNTIEVHTKSICDGIWFGLCNGNIVYVINNSTGEWVVKEIYALDFY